MKMGYVIHMDNPRESGPLLYYGRNFPSELSYKLKTEMVG